MKHSKLIILAIIYSVSALAGCSDEHSKNSTDKTATSDTKQGAIVPQEKNANTAGTDGAQDAPAYVESQNDRHWLTEASKACANQEFRSFFEAFVRSEGVRKIYTSDPIAVITKSVAKRYPLASYFDFPIAMTDYRYISKNSEGTSPNVEYLQLSFERSQSDTYRVDWVRVRYAGVGNDAEGEAEITGTYGLPGYLVFKPTKDCWQLVQDTVYEGPYEGKLLD